MAEWSMQGRERENKGIRAEDQEGRQPVVRFLSGSGELCSLFRACYREQCPRPDLKVVTCKEEQSL